nr:HEPN domain-containing protein [Pseudoroseomonas aerophila]
MHDSSEILSEIETQRNFFAVSRDGTRISFLNTIVRSRQTRHIGGERIYTVSAYPHIVAFGTEHITSSTSVSSLGFLLNDAEAIYHDINAFGTAIDPKRHIDGLLAQYADSTSQKIAAGPHPKIFFYSGNSNIVSAETTMGTITASHRISFSLPGPVGFSLTSEIYTQVDFPGPVPIDASMLKLFTLLRFFEVVAGRRQKILDMYVLLEGDPYPTEISLYPCQGVVKGDAHGASPSPQDLPINGGLDPVNFGSVLSNWLTFDASRSDARSQFSSGFSQGNRYNNQRLVNAANMFDILPADALPSDEPIDPELVEARDAAKKLFKKLPPSIERDSVLGALGRLGHKNLKQKVRHRVEIVQHAAGAHLPDLHLVTDEAVNCRNHYVHGTPGKIDYSGAAAPCLPFLTDTLEFVFATSEFIEAGWDFKEWRQRGTTMAHPWGAYVVDYRDRLRRLKSFFPVITKK